MPNPDNSPQRATRFFSGHCPDLEHDSYFHVCELFTKNSFGDRLMLNDRTDRSPDGKEADRISRIDDELYAELKRLAARRMNQQSRAITFQPTMLVHEAWLRMSSNNKKWKDRHQVVPMDRRE